MKRNTLTQQAALAILFALACILSSPSAALAQAVDLEPNNTCSTAQNIGQVTSTLTINGSIDRILAVSDVDFYRLKRQLWSYARLNEPLPLPPRDVCRASGQ